MSTPLIIALVFAAFVIGGLSLLGLLVLVRVAQLVLKHSIERRAMLDSAPPPVVAEEVSLEDAAADMTEAINRPGAGKKVPFELDPEQSELEKSILEAAARERAKLAE